MNKRLSSVEHYKKSVEQLIRILEEPINPFKKKKKDESSGDATINQVDLKSKLQSKKNAFDRAKETIIAIQDIENRWSDGADIKWLKNNVEKLCNAGELAINEMLGNMDLEIDTSDLGGSEINAAIDVRGKSISDIQEIFDGIDHLKEQLDAVNDKSVSVIKKKKDFSGGYVESRTIN